MMSWFASNLVVWILQGHDSSSEQAKTDFILYSLL